MSATCMGCTASTSVNKPSGDITHTTAVVIFAAMAICEVSLAIYLTSLHDSYRIVWFAAYSLLAGVLTLPALVWIYKHQPTEDALPQ